VFCDWLKVADSAFSYNPRTWRAKIMRTTGREVDWERRAWVDFKQTSSSSSIRARFLETGALNDDGRQFGTLHLDGNLGRFGAASNLFGLPVQDSARNVLGMLGDATDTYFDKPDSLALRRVDLTCNFAFGSAADAAAYIDWAAQHKLGRAVSRHYASGCTWVTQNWSAKVYDKLADMRRHNLNDLADELQRREGYILRLEMTLRTDELIKLKLNTLDKWKPTGDDTMENIIFTDKFAPILRGENLPTLCELADTLPARLATCLQAWRNGMDYQAAMRDNRISRATYYRLRADLLPHGIDIAQRCEVRTLNIRPRLIEMQPLHQPDWWHNERAA
jgi:hypothetical protein